MTPAPANRGAGEGGTQPPRSHPDIFTTEEAAAYLHLDSTASLDSLRAAYELAGFRVGKGYMYHREDLDRCASRMFGKDKAWQPAGGQAPRLRLSGGRA